MEVNLVSGLIFQLHAKLKESYINYINNSKINYNLYDIIGLPACSLCQGLASIWNEKLWILIQQTRLFRLMQNLNIKFKYEYLTFNYGITLNLFYIKSQRFGIENGQGYTCYIWYLFSTFRDITGILRYVTHPRYNLKIFEVIVVNKSCNIHDMIYISFKLKA